jgi:1,2-diacylglycerol 3-alpha-glucosyltransferase
MRILIASSTYAPAMNGQAVFTTNLAEGLAQRGHEVIVVIDSPRGKGSTTTVNGVILEALPSVYFRYYTAEVHFTPFPAPAVRRLIKEFDPHIVHIQDHFPICRVAVHAAQKFGIKIVGSNHYIPENVAPYMPAYTIFKPLMNWVLWQWMIGVYKHADAISAQSVAAAEMIQRQGLKMPVLPISCGIDLGEFHPDHSIDRQQFRQRYGIEPHKKTFMFLGRIDGEKRIDLLLRAAQQLTRDDIQLVIAGTGRVERAMHQMAADLELGERVRFTGFIPQSDLPGLMNSIDVFVMPSEAELLSISTLEAMACSRPVLLVDALALPELVRVGENGYLFKPGDVNDLVYHINLLADQSEYWGRMGMVSRQVALAHSLDEAVEKFEELYDRLVSPQAVNESELGVRTAV